MDSSPAWYQRLIAEWDASDARASAVVTSLGADELNWKPDPNAWSIGQCLEHLCIANEVYLPAIASALEKPTRSATQQEITPGWFGRWFIRNYIAPSPATRRGRAPRKITPHSHVDTAILDRFLHTNARARELAQRARDCNVNSVRFRNPFIPIIYFTIGTGLEITSKHEQRHLLQAERVRDELLVAQRANRV